MDGQALADGRGRQHWIAGQRGQRRFLPREGELQAELRVCQRGIEGQQAVDQMEVAVGDGAPELPDALLPGQGGGFDGQLQPRPALRPRLPGDDMQAVGVGRRRRIAAVCENAAKAGERFRIAVAELLSQALGRPLGVVKGARVGGTQGGFGHGVSSPQHPVSTGRAGKEDGVISVNTG